MSKPPSASRVGWGIVALPLLWSAARAAQATRMPLVAAVILTGAVAWLAGLPLKRQVALRWSWPNPRTWYVGDTAPLTVTVTNDGKRATPVVVLEQSSPGLTMPDTTVPALGPGQSARVTVPLVLCDRRGPLPLSWQLKGHNRLVGVAVGGGLRETGSKLFAVRPQPDLPPPVLLRRLSRAASDGTPSGRKGAADPLLLRQFASGDPVSSVHWRSTARSGSPVVLERDRPSDASVVLLVAGAHPGPGWEAAIARAAGLTEACRAAGVAVGVVAAAPTDPLPELADHDLVQDWLAALPLVGPAQPGLVDAAVRRAAHGVVAVLSSEPWLPAAVAETVPALHVLDLAQPW